MAKILKELKKEHNEKILKEAFLLLGKNINKEVITKFNQIFDYVPKTTIASALGLGTTQFINKRALDGGLWLVDDIVRFCNLTGTNHDKFLKLLINHRAQKE